MKKPSHIRAKKHLSQNFLTDENVIKKIINSFDLKKDDHVIEIGPGYGACLLYTSPSPRDGLLSRMPSSA